MGVGNGGSIDAWLIAWVDSGAPMVEIVELAAELL